MELDEKLREIEFREVVQKNDDGSEIHRVISLTDEAIAQIKQAFKDAGYTESGVENPYLLENTRQAHGWMTGQEWYEWFEKELTDNWPFHPESLPRILEAARRAAGLQEGDEYYGLPKFPKPNPSPPQERGKG